MALHKKSIHELRAIAQGYGITDIFSKDAIQLTQAIELKQQVMAPAPPVPVAVPQYDARLMTKPPSKRSNQDEVLDLLAPHIARGLHVTFPMVEQWHMQWGKREDSGNMRMPLKVVLDCAERLMKSDNKSWDVI